jgi:hypothetical protein
MWAVLLPARSAALARSVCRAVLLARILCACASASEARGVHADVRPEADDATGRWFLISCPDRRTTCTRTAGLLCPGGYLVVNTKGYQIDASLAGLTEVHNGKLRVRCMPAFILDGR